MTARSAPNEAPDIGGKAATLLDLERAGFPVPPSETIGADTLAVWVPGSPPPVPIVARVRQIVERFEDQPLAVRSSAVDEDGAGASYAGMYTTTLGAVGVESVLGAIESCLASAGASRVEAYRGAITPDMAVLIQPMLAPTVAGIAFTADPVSGDALVRVSGVAGIADAVAAGELTPDEWDVRDGVATRRPEAGVDALTASQVLAVADMAKSVEAHLGGPQDVEWAIVDDSVVVLQARPITALPIPPAKVLEGVNWEKDIAHTPEPMTPFGSAIYAHNGQSPVTAMAETYGLIIDDMELEVVGGEVYARVIPAIGSAESTGKPPPAPILGIVARIHPKLRKRMKAAEKAIADGLLEEMPRRWNDVERRRFEESIDRLLDVDLTHLTDEALVTEYGKIVDLSRNGGHLHFQLFMPYLVGVYRLCRLTETKLGWSVEETMAMLESPASDAGRGLESIRKRVAADARLRDTLSSRPSDPVTVLEEQAPSLAEELRRWLRREGWRTSGYDAGSPTIGERPGLVTRLLLSEPRAARDRDVAADRARSALSDGELDEFDAVLAYARVVYPMREDNVILTDNVPIGLLRRWLLEASARLLDRGLIGRLDDGSYLEPGEIHEALTGGRVDLRPIVARRRGEWAWTRAHPGPIRVGPASPAPDVSWLPAAGRLFNEAILWAIQHEYPGEAAGSSGDGALHGAAGSPGIYRGAARLVRGEQDFAKLMPGEVMVCTVTTPAWSTLFGIAGALVTDGGGVLSHAAIVAREHGIPAVLGTGSATRDIRDGDLVEVDGTAGTVTIV